MGVGVMEFDQYPLRGRLPYATEVFDQRLETLPTDQIVTVEVEYEPTTGFPK